MLLSPCSENCEDKLNEFLKRTYYIDAGHDNKDGMAKLNSKMAHIEVEFETTQHFFLTLLDQIQVLYLNTEFV